jgi:hypothetical protein
LSQKSFLVGAVLAFLAAVLVGTIAHVHRTPADQDEEDEENHQAAARPKWLSSQNGRTVLTLDAATRSRAQVSVGALHSASSRQELTALAVVLAVQDLVSQRNATVAAQTRIEKAEASLAVSRREYERLKKLYQDNQNASEKTLQAAEGAFRSDQAEAQGAHQALELQIAVVRQEWGPVVAGWVRDGSGALERLFNRSELLVQVTLPAGEELIAAANVSLQIPNGKLPTASLVAPYPHVDPRVQGASFLYETQAASGLAPGMNLTARLPAGAKARGVLVLESAVVWWQGRAWIYQQIGPDQFTRRGIPTDAPLSNGYFVAEGFSPGDQIVIKGADWLLSEEFRYQAQPEGED